MRYFFDEQGRIRRRLKKGYGGTSKGFHPHVPLLRGGVLQYVEGGNPRRRKRPGSAGLNIEGIVRQLLECPSSREEGIAKPCEQNAKSKAPKDVRQNK